MRRHGAAIGVVALTAVLVAGCGGEGAGVAPEPTSSGVGIANAQEEPTALIGSWTVTDVPGVTGSVLRLGPDGLSVFHGCDVLFGEWRADPDGLFLADVNGAATSDDRRCGAPTEPRVPDWLGRVTGFRTVGDERVLLDERGGKIARLRPGARPSGGPNLHRSQVEPPVVTDEARRQLAPAATLPAALDPPARDAVTGRWVPAGGSRGRHTQPAYVQFHADGRWQGSDGCNGTQGRWLVGSAGALLATGGVSTLIGCDNVPVGAWLITARRVGLDGGTLVLLDAQGRETGRLLRDG